jgi:hypothetical protein
MNTDFKMLAHFKTGYAKRLFSIRLRTADVQAK